MIGYVSEIANVNLRTRFRIGDRTVLASALDRTFPGLMVTQLTILRNIDDILNDPDAVDVLSYTVWCPAGVIPSGLAKRQSVSATIVPVKLLEIGCRWLVESLEQL